MAKRFVDLGFSFALTVILLPVVLIITAILFWEFKGKIFFVQQRTGKNGVIFNLHKFRTMNEACGSDGELLPDHLRLTSFGSMLRKTSLDEVPQLINVMKGEMSLVGPRPLLPEYLPLYSLEQNKRHRVLPGITGLAQVKGRNSLDWPTKFRYDVWYVDNQNFWLDLKIMIKTIAPLLKRENIDAQNRVGMEKFTG
jgi:lipopolysaccharide/colanic/teichoic acid biosynthesis glycosyltransferase